MRRVAVGFCIATSWPSITPAAAQGPLVIPRVLTLIELDGRFGESAWEHAIALPMVGYKPVFGAAPSESTVVRMLHDGRAIYVAASLYDRDPAGVQDRSRARDEDYGGDFVNVLLDAFGDHENAVVFSTTPAGARLDYAIANDAEGPNPSSISWNGFWDVRVRRDGTGWFAEFRIPFSTLRFQPTGDAVRMGLIVNRLIGRRNERIIFPAIEPRWAFGMFKPSQARPVAFTGVTQHRQRILVPYLLAGLERSALPRDPGDPVGESSDLRRGIGGDIKVALTDNVNMDVTVNTDFVETEVDDQRINLGRFPLADPERRQFFLERAGVFDFSFTGDNRLLHTRRIGLTDDGRRVPIYAGVRVVGRAGGWDVGLLDMQTRPVSGQPSTNFGALRVRRRAFNAESYVGAMVTTRVSSAREAAAGADATIRLAGPHFVRITAAAVDGSGGAAPVDAMWDRVGLNAQVERRSTIGLGGSAGVLHLGTAFLPPVGFIESSGIQRLDGRLAYGILAPAGGPVRLVTPSLHAFRAYDLAVRALQTTALAGDATVEMRSGATVGLTVEHRREITLDELRFADRFVVPPGAYEFTTVTASGGSASSGTGSITVRASVGGFYGGHRRAGTVSGVWHPVSAVTVTADYIHERLSLSRDSTATLRVARVRAALAATARLSAAATLQHSTAAHLTSFNLRWRINFREGNDLWLVYDHVLNGDRDRVVPALPGTATQSLLMKFTYAISN